MESNKVYLASVFIRAKGFLGLVEEADIPGPTASMVEHTTIGSIGTLNFFTGFELMEGRFKWKGTSKTIELFAANPFQQHDVQVRSVIQEAAGTTGMVKKKCVVFMKVRPRNAANSNFAPKTDVESETEFDVDYIRKEIDNEVMYEFDPLNFIYKVGGVDMLAEDRAILGLG